MLDVDETHEGFDQEASLIFAAGVSNHTLGRGVVKQDANRQQILLWNTSF